MVQNSLFEASDFERVLGLSVPILNLYIESDL